MLMDGENPYKVAKLLGDTLQTVERTYAHCNVEFLQTKSGVAANTSQTHEDVLDEIGPSEQSAFVFPLRSCRHCIHRGSTSPKLARRGVTICAHPSGEREEVGLHHCCCEFEPVIDRGP